MTGYNPLEFSKNLAKVAEQSQELLSEFFANQTKDATHPKPVDPLHVGDAFRELFSKMISDPSRVMQSQVELWQDYFKLWSNTTSVLFGQVAEPVIQADDKDRRFKDPAWQESVVFDFIKQSYLLSAKWMQEQVQSVEGLDDQNMKKVDFYTRQFVDAMAPSNFLMTNPEAIRATIESNGENLVNGLRHMLEDLKRGGGKLNIRMTDLDAFKIGENIAATPGKVVFQNDLMQLIQYDATTKQVNKTPLLVVAAWINKYYILDLKAENSFIKWAVDQGHTVFVVSWVNPDERHREKSFEDYMKEGPLAALDAIEQATGEKEVNVIAYCLGGTLLAITLAYLAAKGKNPVKSITYFTTMTDFEDAGELSVFIDEEQLQMLENRMSEMGYLDGSEMAGTFNMLRANDLIWSFVVNNYLLGKEPFPFDVLYWNSDSTRLPAKMHSFYLRNMYQKNLVVKPGGITIDGVKIDLRTIKTPTYILSTREDHIAPWKSTYAATQLYAGPTQFVLAGSGHVVGVMNHPSKQKYGYWTNAKNPKTPDEWLKGSTETAGSWWPHWNKWLTETYGGGKIDARKPGEGKLKVIENAPGKYVKERLYK
jgi:polyhydroxyalkanoate synthase